MNAVTVWFIPILVNNKSHVIKLKTEENNLGIQDDSLFWTAEACGYGARGYSLEAVLTMLACVINNQSLALKAVTTEKINYATHPITDR